MMIHPFAHRALLGSFFAAALASCVYGRPHQAAALQLPPGAQEKRDVAYGRDPAQRMDVYIPADAKNAPILMMVHGGGWRRGDKTKPPVVDNKIAHWLPKGFIFISTNYRLMPAADPVEQAEDVAGALAYAQAHARSWGGDPAKFILMGHSAGAHLAALITAAPEISKKAGVQPWLGTISLDSAAYNVVSIMDRRHPHLYDQAFGKDKAFWTAASPYLRLKVAPVPMLLVCSSRRPGSMAQARALAAKIQSMKGRAVVLPEDLSHGEINGFLGLPGPYTERVDAFMASLLK